MITLKDSINKSNVAMMATSMKPENKCGKKKSKRDECHCTNCGLDGHMKDSCFAKGGGKEKQTPEWYKRNLMMKKEEAEALSSANVAKKLSDKNYAMLTFTAEMSATIKEVPISLTITTNFQKEAKANALTTSLKSQGIIIDCGASNHFTPDHKRLCNYKEVKPQLIQAADGHVFSTLGKDDINIKLSNREHKPTPVTLKNVFYSPSMAYTLMSVSIMAQGRYFTHMENNYCLIRTTFTPQKILG